jgi:hypothetical protein
MAVESVANASESRSTRNSIAITPSWEADRAPYERRCVEVPDMP